MWIDDLEATIDKDRIGTHWEGCYLEHKDCAIVRLIDYAVQLERDNKTLSEHNKRMVAGLEQDAKRHPLYGPCDGFDDGACAECNRLFEALQRENKALSVNVENLEIMRKQRDVLLSLIAPCICGHGAERHNNAAHCDICECKEYQG